MIALRRDVIGRGLQACMRDWEKGERWHEV